jgi:hypothetical protein
VSSGNRNHSFLRDFDNFGFRTFSSKEQQDRMEKEKAAKALLINLPKTIENK